MSNRLFEYHVHSDYSTCTTNIDSVTKIGMYIEKAKALGMTALAFSEHGNLYNWYEKKSKIEVAGMKYVHAVEAYITESLTEKLRDNYHFVLMAKNYDGFEELNEIVSRSFNREDGHYYYRPRIYFEELFNTSSNIIVTSACIAGVFRNDNLEFQNKVLNWMERNKDRCFLEIQHHNTQSQILHNKKLYDLHKKTGIRLITGTDIHSLDERYAEAREIMQLSKNVKFDDNENGWDMTFKSYEQLVDSYKKQNSLPMDVVLEAIDNTAVVEDMISSFEVDKSVKYPDLYSDVDTLFKNTIEECIQSHPYALKNHTYEELKERAYWEFEQLKEANMLTFMLFKKSINDWQKANGIHIGPGRGSVSGSMIAYLFGITQMDSIKFDLNFFRFCNSKRVSLADIDEDCGEEDRDRVRQYLLERDDIQTAEIISFNTIQTKGAVKDVARALKIPLNEVEEINKQIDSNDDIPESLKTKYPDLFKYVELVRGIIVSVGTHPAGVLCATRNIQRELGTTTLSTTPYPVTMNDMYGLDACMWCKFDELGLDNVSIINKACELAGIDIITPDNIDLEDKDVWSSISDDTTAIFQYESPLSSQIAKNLLNPNTIAKIKKTLPDITMLRLFSFGNALIRPSGASIRDNASLGNVVTTGIKDIDDLLQGELGNCIVQCDQMLFVNKFCGFDMQKSDEVRKCIAKKKMERLEELIPEIRQGFADNAQKKYNISDEKAKEILDPIIQCMYDGTRYAFSWNHSDAYSFIGYACGWLRYHYPLEFITACLNVWNDKDEKTAKVIKYAKKIKANIKEAEFGYSSADYSCDNTTNTVYKGMRSIKNISADCADSLYTLRNNNYNYFVELLYDMTELKVNTEKINTLIRINFFHRFGKIRELLIVYNLFIKFKKGSSVQMKKENLKNNPDLENIIKRHSNETEKQYNKMDTRKILIECEELVKSMNVTELPIKERMQSQKELLGYINLKTGEQDRRKLIVLDKKTLISKFGKDKGKPWCVMIKTQSVGSGIESGFTIPYNIYSKNKFNVMDIIYCEKYEKRKGYYYLLKYNLVFD